MSQKLNNKIEATDTSINALLKDQKFTIDYFQSDYFGFIDPPISVMV